jgi:hypothetical protein
MSVLVANLIPGVFTSAGPAWVTYGNKTLLVWKGEGSDDGIYWSTTSALKPDSSNQYSWAPQQKVPNIGTSSRPALANLNGVIFMAWKGEGSDTGIYLSKLGSDGTWAPQWVPSGIGGSNDGPALAVTQGLLYMAWMDEPGGTRIFFATSKDGVNWSPQAQVQGVATGAGPALASDGVGDMFLAWKGASGDSTWWSKCGDGKNWTAQQKGPGGGISGPAMAVDSNKVKWLAWYGPADTSPFSTQVPVFEVPGVWFSALSDENNNLWTAGVRRSDFSTQDRPALLSIGGGDSGLMAAYAGPSQNSNLPLYYGSLLLPEQKLSFDLDVINVRMMRTGHAGFKDGTDTVYASISVKVKGKAVQSTSKFVGNLTGGGTNVDLGISFTLQDTDTVYLSYSAINSSQGASSAISFLQSAGSDLLNAVEKADEDAFESATGLPFSQLSPKEAGALIGAQLGNYIIPGFGAVIGAIGGWLADSVGGFLFPDCDGPVALGLYVFSAPQIRAALSAQISGPYNQTDDNPGTNSASGCGQNSDYQVSWTLASQIPLLT